MKKLIIHGFKELNLSKKIVAFDTETTGLNPYGDKKTLGFYPCRPFFFSFCDTEGNTAYIRLPINPFTREVYYPNTAILTLKKILEDETIIKIGHNLSFDIRMSEFCGIKTYGKIFDTLILTHILTGGKLRKYGLKQIGEDLLDISSQDEKDLEESTKKNRRQAKKYGWKIATPETHGKNHIKADYWLAEKDICRKYAVKDAERTMLLFLGMYREIKNNKKLLNLYRTEMKLFYAVKHMEDLGVKVNENVLNELDSFYTGLTEKYLKIIKKETNKEFNPNSDPQLRKAFFEERNYEPIILTEKGLPSSNADSLVYLKNRYQDKLAEAIIEYRSSKHMMTGFITPYKKFLTKQNEDLVIHPNFIQVGPITGRFACSDPNLMQTASDSSGKKISSVELRIRELFIPRKGCIFYLPDYSQIEVWIFSLLSGDNSLIEPLLQGRDFHAAISEQVWGEEKDFKENKQYYRKRAKLLMFCRLYGGGAKQVAKLIGCSVNEAYSFIEDYNNRLPGVPRFMNKISDYVAVNGKLVNPFGRQYFLDADYAYKGVNYLVQGTAADILKRAMIRIHTLFKTKWTGCNMLLTLHDELMLEIPKKYHSNELMRDIVNAMQTDYEIIGSPIPLPVSMKITKTSWAECKEIEFLNTEWKEEYICKKNIRRS